MTERRAAKQMSLGFRETQPTRSQISVGYGVSQFPLKFERETV